MVCAISGCVGACKPRTDSLGKFYKFCPEHFNESRRTDRVRENARRSYRANKELRIARVVARAKTSAAVKAYQAEWYLQNREAVKRVVRAYQQTPKGKSVARRSEHKRRAVAGHYSERQWQARLAFYGWRCYLCGCDWLALPAPERTIDHVIPLARGGTNWPANLRPACRACNCHKHTA